MGTVKREAKTRLVWNGQHGQGDPREGDEGKGGNGDNERMQVFMKTCGCNAYDAMR